MSQTYRKTRTAVSLINYHFVFCPRYRRKVLEGAVEERLKIYFLKFVKNWIFKYWQWNVIKTITNSQPIRHHGKIERSDIKKIATEVFTPEAFAWSVDSELFCIYRRKCIQ